MKPTRVLELPDYEIHFYEKRTERSNAIEAQLLDAPEFEAPLDARPVIRHTLPPRGQTSVGCAPLARTRAALAHDEASMITLPEDRRRKLWSGALFGLTFITALVAVWP